MKYWLSILWPLLFMPLAAHADDHLTLAFGPSLDGTTNPKMAAVGYEKIWGEFSLYTHCGAMFEDPINPWCALVASVRVETPSGIFMRVGVWTSALSAYG